MDTKSHLVAMHTAAGEFHRDCAKAHAAMTEDVACVGPTKQFHQAMRDHHIAAAEKCIACARSASQLDEGDMHGPTKILSPAERFGKAADDGIHGAVAPNPNRILVTRDGSPTPEQITKVEGKHAHIFERESRTAQ